MAAPSFTSTFVGDQERKILDAARRKKVANAFVAKARAKKAQAQAQAQAPLALPAPEIKPAGTTRRQALMEQYANLPGPAKDLVVASDARSKAPDAKALDALTNTTDYVVQMNEVANVFSKVANGIKEGKCTDEQLKEANALLDVVRREVDMATRRAEDMKKKTKSDVETKMADAATVHSATTSIDAIQFLLKKLLDAHKKATEKKPDEKKPDEKKPDEKPAVNALCNDIMEVVIQIMEALVKIHGAGEQGWKNIEEGIAEASVKFRVEVPKLRGVFAYMMLTNDEEKKIYDGFLDAGKYAIFKEKWYADKERLENYKLPLLGGEKVETQEMNGRARLVTHARLKHIDGKELSEEEQAVAFDEAYKIVMEIITDDDAYSMRKFGPYTDPF